jgi:nitrite reductase (NADH) small subunit
VGRADDVVAGTATIVEVEGIEIGLFRVGDGFYAVRNRCPHRGAPVCRGTIGGTMLPSDPGTFEYGIDDGRLLHCPWHHWTYDVTTGRSQFGVDKRRLGTFRVETFEVENVGERLYVWVRPARRSAEGIS